ncbi:hypothetical protein PCASD_26554 [Puccinia coronata f. sp. avenae]|uniref:Integrase catalytic domain-containing protein n=1 Tax=Puccinia coronata f. sp. avenae TaxID=200324 RepID=A0A2N5TR87_9BASI|nr:hypothetical protein PCASD_26554 [Puccinia coronata f. sp. avenae]
MSTDFSLKDQLSNLPTLMGDDNYPMWNRRISAFLKHKELYLTVTTDPGDRPSVSVAKKLSESANILLTKINDKLYNRIITSQNDNNGYLIWTRIRDLFAKRTGLRLSRCLAQWHKIRYEGDLTTYLDHIESCLATFDSISYVQDGSAVCGVIMSSLSEDRSSLADPIITNDELMSDPILLLTKLRDVAFSEKSRKKANGDKNPLALNTSKRTRPRYNCKNGKHDPSAPHPESKCWSVHPDQRPIRNPPAASHNTVITPSPQHPSSQHERPAFASITTASCLITTRNNNPAVLDTGASHHMFNDLEYFRDATTESCSISISTGRNSSDLTAIRKGTAMVAQSTGKILLLPDSLYVPGLTRNLISMTKLTSDNARLNKRGGRICVTIDNSIHFDCLQHNGVLEIEGSIGPVPPQISMLQAVLPGVKLLNEGTCDSCMRGKVSRIPFKSHFDATSHPLEVVHGDLVGPITPSTNSGCRYFLTLVDQHTGFISTTLLKKKSNATAAILDFKQFFENQTGFNLKKLITDGGGEFCNATLSDCLKASGIQHNTSPPYTPQHNGLAERANKTIINMARCMLVHSNLAKEWWGEAVRAATQTTNCLPSLGKSRFSPIEKLFNKVPNIAFFRPFGCKVWIVKPNQLRNAKFDSIAWDGVLLGYSNDFSCYRVIKTDSMTITDSKHVYFDESIFPRLNALRPSVDLSPYSRLPDFSGQSALPFDDEDSELDHQPMDLDQHDDEDAIMNEGPDLDQEDDLQEEEPISSAQPRRLVLRLGPHPTQVTSAVDPSNILARRTRSAAVFSTTVVEPSTHAQAMASKEADAWIAAESRELDNMRDHSVWVELPREDCHHAIPSTWAYKKKLGADNQVTEYKARICAQGFRQTYGLNFDSKYAPTGKPSSLRLLISHALQNDFPIHQLDVKSAFLTCDLEEKVFMLPPPGYRSGENIVLQLKKAIYGLKQASLAWYRRLSSFLKSIGFSISIADPCVFWRSEPSPLWIFSHVDDLIIVGRDPLLFRSQMEKEFNIKYMGDASFLLGMKLDRSPSGIHLHQSQYIVRKLEEFGATDLPPSSCPIDPRSHLKKASESEVNQFKSLNINYRALIGSLNYLSILTRPDVSFAVSKLSQYLENPGITHYKAAMQVLRYLKGTLTRGLFFCKQEDFTLKVYADADWANCPDTRRSHTGLLILRNDHLIFWKSTKQPTVSLSSTEAEYKALSDACKEVVWTRNLTQEIFSIPNPSPTTIFVDNRGAIDLALSQVSQNSFRTKHMDLRLHFVRDLVANKSVHLVYVSTQRNVADFLTKPVGRSVISRSICKFIGCPSSVSALCLEAPSMPGCQSSTVSVVSNTQAFLNQICDKMRLEDLRAPGHNQVTATQTLATNQVEECDVAH